MQTRCAKILLTVGGRGGSNPGKRGKERTTASLLVARRFSPQSSDCPALIVSGASLSLVGRSVQYSNCRVDVTNSRKIFVARVSADKKEAHDIG